jgi:hypothetical protein
MKKKNRRAGAMSRGLSAAAAPEPDSECTGGEPRVLFAEPNTDYWIYPSWADYKVKWGELPPLFADPIGTGCVDLLDQQYIESGVIANTVEPFAMLDGPAGGGIIITPIIKPRGLHGSVTNQFAEYSGAHGVGVDSLNREGSSHIAHVGYLKPLRPLYIGERRPKVYDHCNTTFEHADSAADERFWLVDYVAGKREIAGLDEIPALAAGFGLSARRLAEPPAAVAVEAADWFWEEDHQYVWYQIDRGRDGIGYQFAIVVYVALHMCKVAGRRFDCMHLVAQLETRSRFRIRWANMHRADKRARGD